MQVNDAAIGRDDHLSKPVLAYHNTTIAARGTPINPAAQTFLRRAAGDEIR
jgi:hypothetical protein